MSPEAKRANRVKGEFLADISHEIRTPATPAVFEREASGGVLDIGRFKALAQAIGRNDCCHVVDVFLDQARTLLETMRQELADGDPETLALAAHTLQGSAANLGALQLSELSGELVALARKEDRAGFRRLLSEVEGGCRELEKELRAVLAGWAGNGPAEL